MRIVFSGGGTGGHIFPAVAVAEEVKSRIPDADILFIGAQGKMEMEKIPKAGFEIKGLWISGLQRKLTFRNLLFPVKLVASLFEAYKIIREFKPDVVAGFGGYASGAAVYVATNMGIPTLIQEQNSYPGITNKILSSKVDRICTAYSTMSKYFPEEKIVFTGNPVRKAILKICDRDQAIEHFGLDPKKKIVLVAGGSLGARSLNRALRDNADRLSNMDVQILWQCGSLYINEYKSCASAQLANVRIMAFIDRMDFAYAAADLVICRSGALTVSEICIQSKASILVPSPNVAEDHQTKNAMALVDADAALLIKDADINDEIALKIEEVVYDEELLKKLSSNIIKLAKPSADVKIADNIISLVV